MIGFIVGGAIVLVAAYVIAKHHWRWRKPAASLAADSLAPRIPWHPHSMRGGAAGGRGAGDDGGDVGSGDIGGGDGDSD
ncbi:MAG TPA: hypothetical protein VNA89_15275 [Gemmatimonadaceae bacterium]|nr:hypothetical protein [Gemmatimonadaceae bacterium]